MLKMCRGLTDPKDRTRASRRDLKDDPTRQFWIHGSLEINRIPKTATWRHQVGQVYTAGLEIPVGQGTFLVELTRNTWRYGSSPHD